MKFGHLSTLAAFAALSALEAGSAPQGEAASHSCQRQDEQRDGGV